MEADPEGWILWAGDVSTAFMQGTFEGHERPEPLYLLPPGDAITLRAGTFKAKLYIQIPQEHIRASKCATHMVTRSDQAHVVSGLHSAPP